jgi:DNA-binding MarR family transcriptional regulator
MAYPDNAAEAQVSGWRAVTALNAHVERRTEKVLRAAGDISLVEYTLLDVMHRQSGEDHLRMSQVARATALSESATTRLVDRLEKRGLLARYLCPDDRRGIYAELTAAGLKVLLDCREAYSRAVADALAEAADVDELKSVVQALRPLLLPNEGDA